MISLIEAMTQKGAHLCTEFWQTKFFCCFSFCIDGATYTLKTRLLNIRVYPQLLFIAVRHRAPCARTQVLSVLGQNRHRVETNM